METVLDVMMEIRDELKKRGYYQVPLGRVEERLADLEVERRSAGPGSFEEIGLLRAIAELHKLLGTQH